jgi:hypothetical protein
MEKYNGWTNWETWNAYNWLTSEEDIMNGAIEVSTDGITGLREYWAQKS